AGFACGRGGWGWVCPAWPTPPGRVTPPPLTETVPLRLAVPVFAVALMEKLPLLLPLAGDSLSQLWSSVAVQLTWAVPGTACDAAPAPSDADDGEMVRLLPPHWLSTSGASFSPLPAPAAASAMHFEVAAA